MESWLFTETPLRFLIDPIWRDEAFSFLLASRPMHEIVTITSQDFNPPLYYLVLHIWMILFGTSEIALRSLSVLFAVGGFFAVYEFFLLVMKQSKLRSTIFTCLVVLNPLLLFYAFEARMYSMLFCAAAFAHLWFFLKKPLPLTLTLIAGLYTHYFMGLVIVGQVCALILKRAQIKEYLPYLVAGLVFLPWAVYFLSQLETGGGFWISSITPSMLPHLFSYVYTGVQKDFWLPLENGSVVTNSFYALSFFFGSVIVLASTLSIINQSTHEQLRYWLLQCLVPIGAVLIADLFIPLYLPRYLISLSLALSMIVLILAIQLRGAYAFVSLALFALLSSYFQFVQLDHRDRGDLRETIQEVETLLDTNDLVYVRSELDLMPAQYYAGVDRVRVYDRPYDQIPQYVGKVLIPESLVTNELPLFPQKAAIIEKDRSFSIDFRLNQSLPEDFRDQVD